MNFIKKHQIAVIIAVLAVLSTVVIFADITLFLLGAWDGLTMPFCLVSNILGADYIIHRPDLTWEYNLGTLIGFILIARAIFD